MERKNHLFADEFLFPTDQSKSAWLHDFTAIKEPERYRSVAVSDWGAHLLYQRRLCEC